MAYNLPLHVETHGLEPGAGVPTFVLLHGYGGSSFTWRYWLAPLAARGHVVLVDMKGFGSAPKPDDGRYAPSDQADLVLRLIHQRQLHNVTLIGHSLGGGVALLTALELLSEESARLQRLVLVSGAAYRQRLPPFVALARRPLLAAVLLRVFGWRRVIRFVLRTIVHEPPRVTASQIEGYADPLDSEGSTQALMRSALQIVPDDLDEITGRYPTIGVPTLLLWGRQDRVVPLAVAQRLRVELPDCRLVILEDCGHLPAEERVHESIEALLGFLSASAGITDAADAPGPE